MINLWPYPSSIVGYPWADSASDVLKRPHHEAVEVVDAVPLEGKDGDVTTEEEEDDDPLPGDRPLEEKLRE